MSWQMHRRAGLTVDALAPRASVELVVHVGLRLGPETVVAPQGCNP